MENKRIIVNLYDFDDTLQYPSVYAELNKIASINDQHAQAKSPEFQEKLKNGRVATWIHNNPHLLQCDRAYVITRRHRYQKEVTEYWLNRNNIPYNEIYYCEFQNWQQYLDRKKGFLKSISEDILIEFDYDKNLHIRFFEDNGELCKWGYTTMGFVTYRIKDGQIQLRMFPKYLLKDIQKNADIFDFNGA